MKPEAEARKAARDEMSDRGIYFTPIVGSPYGKAGSPDFVVCVAGNYLEIECKAENKNLEPLQKERLKACEKAGGYYIRFRKSNAEALGHLLDLLLQCKAPGPRITIHQSFKE